MYNGEKYFYSKTEALNNKELFELDINISKKNGIKIPVYYTKNVNELIEKISSEQFSKEYILDDICFTFVNSFVPGKNNRLISEHTMELPIEENDGSYKKATFYFAVESKDIDDNTPVFVIKMTKDLEEIKWKN